METCEVNFNETQPFSFVVERVVDDEIGEKIFEDEKERDGEDDGESPTADVPSTSSTMTTVQDGPSPTPTTTHEDIVERCC
jgi:hypothetical protein